MRYTIGIAMLVLVGCIGCNLRYLGDHATPIVSSVDLPKSRFHVILYGPGSQDRRYGYGIFENHSSSDSYYGYRDLGLVHVDEASAPIVQGEAPGVYRIVWGSDPNAPYAVIDVVNRQIVEDANPANKRNQPLVRER